LFIRSRPEDWWLPAISAKPKPRMNLHKDARMTPHSRLLMVHRVLDQKQPASRVAADFGVSERTVRKWLAAQIGAVRQEIGAADES
jgi:transposase-like protein